MAPKPLPPDQIKPVSTSIGISEREMMGYGPSLWSRLKRFLRARRK